MRPVFAIAPLALLLLAIAPTPATLPGLDLSWLTALMDWMGAGLGATAR